MQDASFILPILYIPVIFCISTHYTNTSCVSPRVTVTCPASSN